MTDDGSAPSEPRMIDESERSAHVSSCSPAAARNVSPAAITTLIPSARSRAASFPIVVVLPTPFTPTKSHTVGPVPSPVVSSGVSPSNIASRSARRASRRASGDFSTSPDLTLPRRSSRTRVVVRHRHRPGSMLLRGRRTSYRRRPGCGSRPDSRRAASALCRAAGGGAAGGQRAPAQGNGLLVHLGRRRLLLLLGDANFGTGCGCLFRRRRRSLRARRRRLPGDLLGGRRSSRPSRRT